MNPADHHRTAGSNDDSELDEHEWERWRRTKELVEKEEGQAEWRKIQAAAKNYDDKSIDRFTREFLITEDFTNARCQKYKKVHQVTDTQRLSKLEMIQWHRVWNQCLTLMYHAGEHVEARRRDWHAQKDLERFIRKVENSEAIDKSIQTPTHYNRHLAQPRFVNLGAQNHGAWLWHNEFYPHRS